MSDRQAPPWHPKAIWAQPRVRKFIGTLLPTFAALGIQLVTFAVTARGLGAEQFGQYSVILAFAAAATELVGLGGADVMVRATARDRQHFRLYFGHMLLLIAVTLPIVVTLCFFIVRALDNVALGMWLIIAGLAGEIAVSRVSASCELAMVAHDHADRAGWLRIVTAGMRLSAALLFFWLWRGAALPSWVAVVSTQAALTSALLLLAVVVLYGKPQFDFIHAETWCGFAFCANQFARSTQGNLDRMILGRFADAASLGIYSAASRMMQVGLFPLQVATRLTYPRFFVEGAKGMWASRRYAVRLAPVYLLVGVGAGVLVAAASWALPFVIGKGFDGTSIYGMWLACSLPFMALQYPAADALTGAGFQSQRAYVYWASTLGFGFVMVLGVKFCGAPGLIGGYIIGQAVLAAILWGITLMKKAEEPCLT